MQPRESDLVDQMARLLAGGGLPLAAARMWAWLLICDPPQQTAADLAEALQASRGSISGSARLLETAGLIRRSSRRGDRREYFSIPPGAIVEVLRSRLPVTTTWRHMAEQGLDLFADRDSDTNARLRELRDVYQFMERELPAMIERFVEQYAADGREPTP